MLPNLFFLENHSDPSTRDFLVKNLTKFKKLGYCLALELPADKTLLQLIALYTAQVDSTTALLSLASGDSDEDKMLREGLTNIVIKPSQSIINFLKIIQSTGIRYVCTDSPKLQHAALESAFNFQSSTQFTKVDSKRDQAMAKKILEINGSEQRPIIYYGGLAHNELVKAVAGTSFFPAEVILIRDPRHLELLANYAKQIKQVMNFFDTSQIIGTVTLNKSLQNQSVRQKFYGQEAYCFDLAPGFSEFDYMFALTGRAQISTHLTDCEETPAIGADFNRLTKAEFKYSLDEQMILHAKISDPEEAKLKSLEMKIHSSYPKLQTFFSKHENQSELIVKGINLPENNFSKRR